MQTRCISFDLNEFERERGRERGKEMITRGNSQVEE